jgi:hypothetical protein
LSNERFSITITITCLIGERVFVADIAPGEAAAPDVPEASNEITATSAAVHRGKSTDVIG